MKIPLEKAQNVNFENNHTHYYSFVSTFQMTWNLEKSSIFDVIYIGRLKCQSNGKLHLLTVSTTELLCFEIMFKVSFNVTENLILYTVILDKN